MISSDFRTEARRRLSGKWGKAACIVLAYVAICFVIGFIECFFPSSITPIFSIINLVIGVPLVFGLIVAFMKLYNDEEVKAFDFCSLGFSNFAKSWKVSLHILLKLLVPIILIIVSYVLIGVGTVGTYGAIKVASSVAINSFGTVAIIGFILLIVSTIWVTVKSYYYQIAYFIAVDNSDLTAKEAVEKSKELMTGNRAKLFWLELSFIGWTILAAFTFGIAYLWLTPYILFATIAFYKFVSGNSSNVEAKVVTENNDNPVQGE